jgi:hypothetical protein
MLVLALEDYRTVVASGPGSRPVSRPLSADTAQDGEIVDER